MSIRITKCPKCGYIAPNALLRKRFYQFGCPNLCFSKLLQK